jgi:ankyrin repeat protein
MRGLKFGALSAAMDGSPSRLSKCLAEGADPSATDSFAFSCVWHAVNGGHEKCVRLLAEAGADMDAKPAMGDPPLVLAARLRRVSILRILVEAGCDLEASGSEGLSALEIATRNRNAEMVRILAGAGCDIDARGSQGNTAAMMAAGHGCIGSLRALLAAGCDLGKRNDLGYGIDDYVVGDEAIEALCLERRRRELAARMGKNE